MNRNKTPLHNQKKKRKKILEVVFAARCEGKFVGWRQWSTLCCWITLHTNWLQSACVYFCSGADDTRTCKTRKRARITPTRAHTKSGANERSALLYIFIAFALSAAEHMAKTPTHVAFARAKQCLEARRRSRAGAVWRWGWNSCRTQSHWCASWKTKGGGVPVELQPAVSLRRAAGFLRRRCITPSPLSCLPEETWA